EQLRLLSVRCAACVCRLVFTTPTGESSFGCSPFVERLPDRRARASGASTRESSFGCSPFVERRSYTRCTGLPATVRAASAALRSLSGQRPGVERGDAAQA